MDKRSTHVYVPSKNGKVMTIDFNTIQRLKERKARQAQEKEEQERQNQENQKKQQDEENKRQSVLQQQREKDLLKQKEEMERLQREAMEKQKRRKTEVQSVLYKFLTEQVKTAIEDIEDQMNQLKQKDTPEPSEDEETSKSGETVYQEIDSIKQEDIVQVDNLTKVPVQANINAPVTDKIREIFEILKLSKDQFQNQIIQEDGGLIYKADPFGEEQQLSLFNPNKIQNKKVNHKNQFKMAVPCGKNFGKQAFLSEMSEEDIQRSLFQSKEDKLNNIKQRSITQQNSKSPWKPTNYIPKVFKQEQLLVSASQDIKVYPHSRYPDYMDQFRRVNTKPNTNKLRDYDEPGFSKLNKKQQNQTIQRINRYNNEKELQFPSSATQEQKSESKLPVIGGPKFNQTTRSLSPRAFKEKGWRPHRTAPQQFSEKMQEKGKLLKPHQKLDFSSNSMSPSNQSQQYQNVKKIQYPIIKNAHNSSPSRKKLQEIKNQQQQQLQQQQPQQNPNNYFKENKDHFYKPHFKDLNNNKIQNDFDNKLFNQF